MYGNGLWVRLDIVAQDLYNQCDGWIDHLFRVKRRANTHLTMDSFSLKWQVRDGDIMVQHDARVRYTTPPEGGVRPNAQSSKRHVAV
jgi:hypothetical protein